MGENVANEMAKFYTDKITKIRQNLGKESCHIDAVQNFSSDTKIMPLTSFTKITPEDLKNILKLMKSKTSTADPIPTWVVKEAKSLLEPIFLHIINLSLSQNSFPDALKVARITPILKNETKDVEDFHNYRPVSNLEFLSKLLERSIYCQLLDHIEKNHLLAKYQSAYRRHHSCETAMIYVVDDIQRMLDDGKNVALILLDLSAAFDTVDHQILLERLEKENFVTKGALQLIKSYLEGRKFSVTVGKESSDLYDLLYGVPQGSILGPLFYLLYTIKIEKIAEKHDLKIHVYADDCSIYMPFEDGGLACAKAKITECIDEIKTWMSNNFLKLNKEKTNIMLFKPRCSSQDFSSNSFCLTQDNSVIRPESEVKLLGITLEPSLSFSKFVEKKIRTCNFHLRNLKSVKHAIPYASRILLVKSMILSQLDYGNGLLIGVPKYVTERLQKVLNKAVRFIYNVNWKDHMSPYLCKLHILPIEYRIKYKVSLVAYKVTKKMAPDYLINKMKLYKRHGGPLLRHGSARDELTFDCDLSTMKSHNKIDKIIVVWNKLPYALRNSKDIATFETGLKMHYFKEAYKSLL